MHAPATVPVPYAKFEVMFVPQLEIFEILAQGLYVLYTQISPFIFLLLLYLCILTLYLVPMVVPYVIVSATPSKPKSEQATAVPFASQFPSKRVKIASRVSGLYVIVVEVLVASNQPHASSKSASPHAPFVPAPFQKSQLFLLFHVIKLHSEPTESSFAMVSSQLFACECDKVENNNKKSKVIFFINQ